MSRIGNNPEFIDNGNAPEFFANGVHAIENMGSVSRIIFFALRRTPEGGQIREPVFTVVVPTEQLGDLAKQAAVGGRPITEARDDDGGAAAVTIN